ncbi:MAG: hypothetical protein ACOVRN_01855 [Flavobacterium sp.]
MSNTSFQLLQETAKNQEATENAIIQENCAIVKQELVKVLNHELTRNIQEALKTNDLIRGKVFSLKNMDEYRHSFSLNSFAMNKCKLPMSSINDELQHMFKYNIYINPKVTIHRSDTIGIPNYSNYQIILTTNLKLN